MQGATDKNAAVVFLAYTGLGYLALLLHAVIFGPSIEEVGGRLRTALVLANLAAGSWCFCRALRVVWMGGVRPRQS